MKLLGSTKSKWTKDKNGENVPHLEIVGSLLEISPPNHIFLKTFNSEFQEIKVWFTDQTSKPLEVTHLTLIIK